MQALGWCELAVPPAGTPDGSNLESRVGRRPRRLTRVDRVFKPLDFGAQKRNPLRKLGGRQVIDVLPNLVSEGRFGFRAKSEFIIECRHAVPPASIVRRRR